MEEGKKEGRKLKRDEEGTEVIVKIVKVIIGSISIAVVVVKEIPGALEVNTVLEEAFFIIITMIVIIILVGLLHFCDNKYVNSFLSFHEVFYLSYIFDNHFS